MKVLTINLHSEQNAVFPPTLNSSRNSQKEHTSFGGGKKENSGSPAVAKFVAVV